MSLRADFHVILDLVIDAIRDIREKRDHDPGGWGGDARRIITALTEMEAHLMAKFDDIDDALDAIDDFTNTIAANVQRLIDEINATQGTGLDGPQTEAVIAHLAALKDTLGKVAADSASPIPEVPPSPPTL